MEKSLEAQEVERLTKENKMKQEMIDLLNRRRQQIMLQLERGDFKKALRFSHMPLGADFEEP
jgi:hypothetical protein